VAGGIGYLAHQTWWQPVILGSASFSAVMFILFWDGRLQKLDAKGGVGVLIDLGILVALLVLN
jgi:hypothetical protein